VRHRPATLTAAPTAHATPVMAAPLVSPSRTTPKAADRAQAMSSRRRAPTSAIARGPRNSSVSARPSGIVAIASYRHRLVAARVAPKLRPQPTTHSPAPGYGAEQAPAAQPRQPRTAGRRLLPGQRRRTPSSPVLHHLEWKRNWLRSRPGQRVEARPRWVYDRAAEIETAPAPRLTQSRHSDPSRRCWSRPHNTSRLPKLTVASGSANVSQSSIRLRTPS
jgi:hypothetical protein